MAMIIRNNLSAVMALHQLNSSNTELAKRIKEAATGQRINNAGDDASGYAISEKMRSRLRALGQDIENVQTGSSLLRVAEGGIQNIIEEIRSLKKLALDAANDTNTDTDRATLQREFDQRRANIDSIAMDTDYNGKRLLDGTYAKKEILVTTNVSVSSGSSNTASTTSILVPTDPAQVGPTDAVVHSGAAEPSAIRDTINTGTYNITQSGVYTLASGAKNITIASGVHDVKFVQASGATLTNIHITGPSDGNANLWIDNLTIQNTDTSSFIKFQGANNTLNFTGNNTFNIDCPAWSANSSTTVNKLAAIHVGDGLTVEGGQDGSGRITFNHNYFSGAIIGSDEDEQSTAPITVNSGYFTANARQFSSSNHTGRLGALVGSGRQASIGDLTINGGTFIDNSQDDVTIGSGSSGGDLDDRSNCGNITVRNTTIIADHKISDPAIGNGSFTGGCGDIYVTNSDIHIINRSGAGIGSADCNATYRSARMPFGNITVENTRLYLQSVTGAGIGTGEYGRVGDITVNNCDLTNVTSTRGEYVGRGVNGEIGTVTINGIEIDPNSPGNQAGSNGVVEGYSVETKLIPVTTARSVGKPLVIHHGTKANQALNVYINDMRTKSLKTDVPSEDDKLELARLTGEKAAAYQAVLDEASGKSLADARITTRHDANVSLRIIDGALQYALDAVTQVGAYRARLEFTESNLTVASENTQASESVLRDADMAKSMVEYTKANVLLQASQSMLAQANQNASATLSLLQ